MLGGIPGALGVRRPANPAIVGFVVLVMAACGTGGQSSPSSGTPSASPAAATTTSAVPTSAATAEQQPSSSATSSLPPAGSGVLLLCISDPAVSSTDIDCRDAVDVAIEAAAASHPVRAEMRWSPLCTGSGSCPAESPDGHRAFVVVVLADGTGVEVPIRLENAALLATGGTVLSVDEVGRPPTVISPTPSKADVGPAPVAVRDRPELPYCGSEKAGLAGPFNAAGRRCFLDSTLAGKPAEFASGRADVGGVPFLEVWRFPGAGPVKVLLGQAGQWSEMTCALTIVTGLDQVFDHTDCSTVPIA